MPLYHYTSKRKARAIVNTEFIRASPDYGPNGRDAILGTGVYFTDLPPRTSTEKLMWNNYGESAKHRDPNIVNAYIEIPRRYVDAFCEKLPGNRKVFLAPTENGLDLEDIPYEWGFRN